MAQVLIHAGALGDLVLALHFARSADPRSTTPLQLIARTHLGSRLPELLVPRIAQHSPDSLQLHWLFGGEGDPPEQLAQLVCGHDVISMLGGGEPCAGRLRSLSARSLLDIDPRPRPGSQRHIVDHWRTAAAGSGRLIPACARQSGGWQAVVPKEFRTACRRRLGIDDGARVVLIHPGSGGAGKCWPAAAFAETAQRLQRYGFEAGVVLGPVELERWSAEQCEPLRRAATLFRAESADGLVELLAASDLWIGNDSGPSHLAALLSIPTIVLFGPTSAAVWKPIGAGVAAIQGESGTEASWGIDVDRVVGEALAMVGSRG